MKSGYVMLMGDDGLPKMLPCLCLHSQSGQLVCGYSWLSGSLPFFVFFFFLWKRTDVFLVAASSGRLALHGHVSTTDASVDSGGGECGLLSDLCQHSCVSLM